MSDINLNDDLLNYELGDDIDDQALYGADEDELLLSDDELEKVVSKEVKQQMKAEAEQWVQEQILDKKDATTSREGFHGESIEPFLKPMEVAGEKVGNAEATEVTSSAVIPTLENFTTRIDPTDDVSTSEGSPRKLNVDFKEPTQHKILLETPILSSHFTSNSSADEVTSSSSKEVELDHSSAISCSTGNLTDSSFIQSSQESCNFGVGMSASDYSDPREDLEEERETRTNIKVTSEREVDNGIIDHSADKHLRYMPGKRGGALLRPHTLRGSFHGQRPLLRYPPAHGHFPLQQTYTPHNTSHVPNPGNLGIQTHIPNTPAPLHQHESLIHNIAHRPRHPYPGFRPTGPMGFRHPNQAGMFPQLSHEYNSGGAVPFNHNYGHMHQSTRAIFRPEFGAGSMVPAGNSGSGPGPGSVPIGLRPNMRLPRPPGPNVIPQTAPANYVNGPTLRHHQTQQTTRPPLQVNQEVATSSTGTVPTHLSASGNNSVPPNSIRPNKVLINPNFKGGVQAATNKFIKETQFMSTISSHVSHLQSDDELLRQQEEFINKNREHIEKRRNERSPGISSRRSRSRSRSRSHTRDRSYTPPNKRNAGGFSNSGTHFERDRDRLDRERDRDRDRGMDRDRSGNNNGSLGARNNRFRRGNSRDRDYDKRVGNYGKRRRSLSPLPSRSGVAAGNSRRERERNDVEEDEETRAYRLEIEKQKALREKILRDKEMKRRRAAEEKQYEEKRPSQPSNNSNPGEEQLAQKLKPIVITERKMISLKKRQQQAQHQQPTQSQRKQIPTAKILPEAKRTLTDHLTQVSSGGGGGGISSSNTAVIKPVPKKEAQTPTPPPVAPLKQSRRLSTPSDDEVQLDYDEYELMIEEEDRLLATPTPSPPALPASRTPTPEPERSVPAVKTSVKSSRHNSNSGGPQKTAQSPFSSSNRRVVLKSSSSSASGSGSGGRKEIDLSSSEGSRNRRSGAGGSTRNNSSSRKAIFDRLDSRRQLSASGSNNDGKRAKGQRIVLKHD